MEDFSAILDDPKQRLVGPEWRNVNNIQGAGSGVIWTTQARALRSSSILGKFLKYLVPSFSHLPSEDNITTHSVALLWGR